MFKEGGRYAGGDKGGRRVQGRVVGGQGSNAGCLFVGSILADAALSARLRNSD